MSTYYVDNINGVDSHSGLEDQPWRSLARVAGAQLNPGDSVLFKRGGVWNGTGANNSTALLLSHSGTQELPITIGVYGDGPSPIISNHGDETHSTHIIGVRANYIIVRDISLQDSFYSAVWTTRSYANHHIQITNNEITNTGVGIIIECDDSQFSNNYIHDLNMIVNMGSPDDHGANGFTISGSNNEIFNNTLMRCRAVRYIDDLDGGAFEFWKTADNNYVHHNHVEDCCGVAEIGGQAGDHANNNILANNFLINNCHENGGAVFCWHLPGTSFGIPGNFIFENNTINELAPHPTDVYSLLAFSDVPGANFTLKNNNIRLNDFSKVCAEYADFIHTGNTYQFYHDKTTLGYEPDPTEIVSIGDNMNILVELQNLLAEIETQLVTLHTQSELEATKILAAQQAKAEADASIGIYDQVKQKCLEMIDLLTP